MIEDFMMADLVDFYENILDLVQDNPHDQTLGQKVRKYVKSDINKRLR